MAKITYTNKVALNENPEIALINKVTDDDLNEIKSVVNTNDDNVGDLTNLTTTTKTNIVAAVNELNSDKAEDDIILIQSTEPSSETNILWINDGQIGTPASEITNSYSTSTGIGYSANYVNNLNTYSTTEHRVGTWIDGKPIYRKTYSLTSGSYSGNVVVDNIPTNLDKLIRFDGFGYQSNDSAWIPIPAPNTNAFTYQIEVYVLSSKLYVGLGSNRTLGSMYITIEYTKTTD